MREELILAAQATSCDLGIVVPARLTRRGIAASPPPHRAARIGRHLRVELRLPEIIDPRAIASLAGTVRSQASCGSPHPALDRQGRTEAGFSWIDPQVVN